MGHRGAPAAYLIRWMLLVLCSLGHHQHCATASDALRRALLRTATRPGTSMQHNKGDQTLPSHPNALPPTKLLTEEPRRYTVADLNAVGLPEAQQAGGFQSLTPPSVSAWQQQVQTIANQPPPAGVTAAGSLQDDRLAAALTLLKSLVPASISSNETQVNPEVIAAYDTYAPRTREGNDRLDHLVDLMWVGSRAEKTSDDERRKKELVATFLGYLRSSPTMLRQFYSFLGGAAEIDAHHQLLTQMDATGQTVGGLQTKGTAGADAGATADSGTDAVAQLSAVAQGKMGGSKHVAIMICAMNVLSMLVFLCEVHEFFHHDLYKPGQMMNPDDADATEVSSPTKEAEVPTGQLCCQDGSLPEPTCLDTYYGHYELSAKHEWLSFGDKWLRFSIDGKASSKVKCPQGSFEIVDPSQSKNGTNKNNPVICQGKATHFIKESCMGGLGTNEECGCTKIDFDENGELLTVKQPDGKDTGELPVEPSKMRCKDNCEPKETFCPGFIPLGVKRFLEKDGKTGDAWASIGGLTGKIEGGLHKLGYAFKTICKEAHEFVTFGEQGPRPYSKMLYVMIIYFTLWTAQITAYRGGLFGVQDYVPAWKKEKE